MERLRAIGPPGVGRAHERQRNATARTGRPPPRLLALRLQGFKSFAERTNVEFGGGISAVVGPNGSGKSNLADALRWALGEQGRALRSRKAEDVIWAGSDRRAAQGMADVTLVVDNADGLLPVDFSVLELGRRLYRSGENDYLLNKQRIRLRDLVDLLDAAHLADNAFLFIGQGMVDQALALRPEERRPLFEEVAGVRRHERRRRRAAGPAARVRGEPRPGRGHRRGAAAAGASPRRPGRAADEPPVDRGRTGGGRAAGRPCALVRGGRERPRRPAVGRPPAPTRTGRWPRWRPPSPRPRRWPRRWARGRWPNRSAAPPTTRCERP